MADNDSRLSRRGFLGRAAAVGATLTLPPSLAGAAGAATAAGAASAAGAAAFSCTPAFRTSLSVSPFTEAVLKRVTLSDGVRTARTMPQVQQLYNAHGATEVYARIATSKSAPGGDSDSGWESGLTRARLARELGMPFNPEIMLCGTYGDGATYQDPPIFDSYPEIRLPGPWTTLTLEQMLPPLRQYGALIARQILNTGVRVGYWDLGNEVENGIAGVCVYPLFPTSQYKPPDHVDPLIKTQSTPGFVAEGEKVRIAFCQRHLWPYVAQLIAAARDGIRSIDRSAKFSTHISDFAQATPATQLAFWQVAKDHGYLPDLLGTSYYPTDGKTTTGPADKFQWFKDVATGLGQKFGRRVFIAEYGYPSATMPPPYPFNDDVPGYTQSEADQDAFTHDLVAWGVKSGRLAGLRPWAPDYCTNSGWQPMSWFDVDGTSTAPKPALHAMSDAVGLQRCAAPVPLTLTFRGETASGGLRVELRSSGATLRGLTLALYDSHRMRAHEALPAIGPHGRSVTLRVPGRRPAPGRYRLSVLHGRRTLLARSITLR
jgi:arabinogalactan endo-1,4-beta-galactosidase